VTALISRPPPPRRSVAVAVRRADGAAGAQRTRRRGARLPPSPASESAGQATTMQRRQPFALVRVDPQHRPVRLAREQHAGAAVHEQRRAGRREEPSQRRAEPGRS